MKLQFLDLLILSSSVLSQGSFCRPSNLKVPAVHIWVNNIRNITKLAIPNNK